MDKKLSIAIGSDHAGFGYKELLREFLTTAEIKDFGAYSEDSADYPDFAHPVASAVESGDFTFGILVCGSANGVAITANKHKDIRAAICWNEDIAELARKHNNANVLCIPARFVSPEAAKDITRKFLETEFEGGRHALRVNKISC